MPNPAGHWPPSGDTAFQTDPCRATDIDAGDRLREAVRTGIVAIVKATGR